jgi:5'-phosphate synthase pdxT subunit
VRKNEKPVIALLALQGAFHAHGEVLRSLGAETREVRLPAELEGTDGLVLPGGESTTLLRLIDEYGFEEPIRRFVAEGKPVLATCMGLILLARKVTNPAQRSLGLLDVTVERNAYGRQVDSFEATGEVFGRPFPMVFIRAPRIVEVGKDVEVVGTLHDEPVLVRQGNILATTFHPELSGEVAVHGEFLGRV